MPKRVITTVVLAIIVTSVAPLSVGLPAEAWVVQRASLRVSPGIVQNGVGVRSPDDAALLGTVTFRPIREGRLVLIQRQLAAGDWHTVARTRENARGVIHFRRDASRGSRAYTYRAIATKTQDGLARIVSNAQSAAVWLLRFSDRFGGTSLNRGKWDYRNLNVRTGSRQRSQSNRSAVRVRGGALRLLVRKNPRRPRRYYLNGHIGTQGNFSFRYGYAAARVKFEKGRGQHGAFWLQPQSPAALHGSAARTGTEIDVAEFFGRGSPRGGMASYVYSYPRRGVSVKSGRVLASASRALRGGSDRWWSRYHVFSVHWTRSGYIFRIDGVETWRHSSQVSRQREYLILSLLTSDWELPRLNRDMLPTSMKVDWVRVWQH